MAPLLPSDESLLHSRKRTKLKRSVDAAVLFLLSLSLFLSGADALDTSCRAELFQADRDGDSHLDRTEFVDAVNRLSGGSFGKARDLPSVLQDTFDRLSCQCEQGRLDACYREGSKSIDLIRLMERTPHDDDMCREINSSIYQALQAQAPSPAPKLLEFPCPVLLSQSRQLQAVNVTFIECVLAMNAADSNNDNFLKQSEYIAFVNGISDNKYSGQNLATVPVEIRRNFFQLNGVNGQIDTSGSTPGDVQTDEQLANLQNICTSTVNAINAVDGTPTAAPTSASSPSAPTAAPVFSQTDCFIAMNSADVNNNSQLNQNEYFTFVNIAAGGAFDGLTFADLDVTLRRNYFMWRDQTTNQINIFGATPGEDADADQIAFLDMICTETEQAVDAILNTPVPGSTPTVAPTITTPVSTPTTAPTMTAPISTTTTAPVEVPTLAPTTLEPIVIPTFAPSTTVSSPTIAPTASDTVDVPTTVLPTTEPTTVAPVISPTAVAPSSAAPVPTGPPAAPPPTPEGAEYVTISSSFVISNTDGISADEITNSQNLEDLTEAYNNLAGDVVAGLAQGRRLRRRRLTVSYVDNSAVIASIADMARCPMGTPEGTVCQMAIASYRVLAVNESAQSVKDDYTVATDAAINMGALQEELDMVNPSTPINVVEIEVPAAPTSAPTPPPSGDSALSNGVIAGIAVAGFVVVAVAAGALFRTQRKHVPPKKKPLGGDVDLDSIDYGFAGPGKAGSMRPSQNDASGSYPFGTSGAQAAAAVSATSDNSCNSDDYSFQSGSFYEESQSRFQLPASPAGTTASQLQNYEFDDPSGKPYGAAAVGAVAGATVGIAAAKQYESSSNAGSSGWSSSEEDTDYSNGSSYSSARSDEEESNDSFFNNKNVAAESRDKFFDGAPAQETSAQPQSEESGSYDDSTFSSDFTPQPASPPEADKSVPVLVPVPIPMPTRSDEESSESYTSSDNSSYDESTFESSKSRGFESGDTSTPSAALDKSSGEAEGRSYESQDLQDSLNERATELESLVERGDWEGVIASAQKFEADTEAANTPSSHGSRKGESSSDSIPKRSSGSGSSYSSSGSESESSSGSQFSRSYETREADSSLETSGDTDYTGTSTSETPEDALRRAEYRADVEALVKLVVPEEIDNVDAMMVQFRGREAELVSTLRNMQERSVTQRARAAVHKSKGKVPRRDPVPGQYRKDGKYSTDSRMSERADDTHGSAAGSAAIAAASVPRPATGSRVPIHLPPIPPHESTQLESLGSSSTPSAQSTSDSYNASNGSASRSASASQSRSTSQSAIDSKSRPSDKSSSSSTTSSQSGSGSYDSRSKSSSGSSGSSSGSYSEEDENYTFQGTGTNYETSQGTSFGT